MLESHALAQSLGHPIFDPYNISFLFRTKKTYVLKFSWMGFGHETWYNSFTVAHLGIFWSTKQWISSFNL